MKRIIIFHLAVGLAGIASPEIARGSCTSGNGLHPNHDVAQIVIESSASSLTAEIRAGYQQWNNGPCVSSNPNNPVPYPSFGEGGGGPTIIFRKVQGVSPVVQGARSCAIYSGSSNGGTVSLYTKIPSFGVQVNCDYSDPEQVTEIMTHELGHFLGLANSNCNTAIMGPRLTKVSGGTAWDITSERHILTSECSLADLNSQTPEEDLNEGPGPGGEEECTECPSPIIVDLDRDGFSLAGLEDAVFFDIDADGTLDEIGWTWADQLDGFLALDRNGNGVIDDGSELFGNHTPLLAGGVAPHGYIPLAEFDQQAQGGNEDGVIDSGDAVFSLLRLWIDSDHDGVSLQSELVTLEDAGVVRLEFRYFENRHMDTLGNWFRYNSKAWVEGPGNSELPVKTSDVFFVVAE